MTCPEKAEIPYIQAPPPPLGFIQAPPVIPHPPPHPSPYVPTVTIQHINNCVTCQNGIYKEQWNGWIVFFIVLIVLMFFPFGLIALFCLAGAVRSFLAFNFVNIKI